MGESTPQNFGGGVQLGSPNTDPISDQLICNFSVPFPDLAS